MGEQAELNPFVAEIDLPKADEDLIAAYRRVGRSVDDLAYTGDFDQLYQLFTSAGHNLDKHEVFRRLLILRKSGLLPRMFGSPQAPPAGSTVPPVVPF